MFLGSVGSWGGLWFAIILMILGFEDGFVYLVTQAELHISASDSFARHAPAKPFPKPKARQTGGESEVSDPKA